MVWHCDNVAENRGHANEPCGTSNSLLMFNILRLFYTIIKLLSSFSYIWESLLVRTVNRVCALLLLLVFFFEGSSLFYHHHSKWWFDIYSLSITISPCVPPFTDHNSPTVMLYDHTPIFKWLLMEMKQRKKKKWKYVAAA